MLADLRRRLEPLGPLAQVVLLLDCAPCHAHQRVAHAAARNKIIMVFLVSSMTASLQPLDAFVFASLKRQVTHTYERLILNSDGEKRTELFVIELLRTARACLFEQDWLRAFRGCGFGGGQTVLTHPLKNRFSPIIPEGGVPTEL